MQHTYTHTHARKLINMASSTDSASEDGSFSSSLAEFSVDSQDCYGEETGEIEPYRFEPYASSTEMDTTDGSSSEGGNGHDGGLPMDLGRLQNTEW